MLVMHCRLVSCNTKDLGSMQVYLPYKNNKYSDVVVAAIAGALMVKMLITVFEE